MIEFSNVSKVYPNGVVGLDDVNLTIEQGEFVGIIGLSGAGKSTLLRTINRMHDITSGTLTVDGQEVKNLKGKQLRKFRRNIGMIFQSFNLVTRTTVIRNVLMAKVPEMPFWRVLLGIFKKEDKLNALEALDKVGILDKAYIRADQLSGGQQQRVALARTLAQNPKIILADEPVAALDPVTAKQVMSDFKKINQEMNITILINIHHVELALAYADRIIGIRAGKIVYDGPSADVTEDVLNMIYAGKIPDEVEEKRTRTPLVLLLLLIATVISVRITGFSLNTILTRGNQFFVILGQMFPPKTGYLSSIWGPLLDTIKMSLLGSFIGGVLAIPFAILASSNLVKNKVVLGVVRIFLSIVRTIPTLVAALIATYIWGLGTMAGTVAIAVFTFAYVGKQLYELIETVDMGAYEAMEAMGAGRAQAFLAAIQPQVLPAYLSVCLFCFEGNVRYAAILGYVGAGGLGLILNEKIGWREYDSVGMILVVLFGTVLVIEALSHYIRKKLT